MYIGGPSGLLHFLGAGDFSNGVHDAGLAGQSLHAEGVGFEDDLLIGESKRGEDENKKDGFEFHNFS